MALEWRRDTSRTYKTLKWLILPMSCVGWYKDRFTRKLTKCLQTFCVIFNLAVFLVVLAIIAYTLVITSTNTAISVTSLIHYAGATIILLYGNICIPRRFSKFISDCDYLKDKDSFYEISGNINIGILISGVIFIIFLILQIAITFYQLSLAYGDLTFMPSTGLLIISITILNLILYFFQKFLVLSTAHCLCWILRTEAVEVSKELIKMTGTVPQESQIEEVKRRYIDITDLTEKADNILCPMISILMITASFFICFLVNAIFVNQINGIGRVIILMYIVWEVYNLVFLLTESCLLYEGMSACVTVPSRFNVSNMTLKTGIQTMLLIETMKNKNVGLSFMKMFILNKQTVLTVVGTLVTYIIVVLQFKPD